MHIINKDPASSDSLQQPDSSCCCCHCEHSSPYADRLLVSAVLEVLQDLHGHEVESRRVHYHRSDVEQQTAHQLHQDKLDHDSWALAGVLEFDVESKNEQQDAKDCESHEARFKNFKLPVLLLLVKKPLWFKFLQWT